MKKLMFLSLCLMFGFSISTFAQTKTPQVTKRQKNQQVRIAQGVKSGEITKREYVGLQRQQANIQKTKLIAKSDGVVTKKERAILHRKENNASQNIYKQKHDRQDRN